jgi:hypothetical protein
MALVTFCLLSPTYSNAFVGTITEQTGLTEIRRQTNVIPSAKDSGVEMRDTITTANGRAGITFKDDTKVQITEHSRLVIDNFVYDDSKKTGKLSMKMALGTIKYASGQIAKNDPQQVVVETPTATIGVRGTDFSGTVDEIGRSTIILLPSCPTGWKNIQRDCVVGSITVTTDMGTVVLTRPFEAVSVQSRIAQPKSSILNLSLDQINNLIIVSPPAPVRTEPAAVRSRNLLDEDFLNKDFLKYDELDKNQLDEYRRLDENFLDKDYLYNFLDVAGTQLLSNELSELNTLLPKYDARSRLKYFIENEAVTLFRETVSSFASVTVSMYDSTTLRLTQEGLEIKQVVNSAGTTTITIRQSN